MFLQEGMDSYVDPYELIRHQLLHAQVSSASRLASDSAQDRHPNNHYLIDMALATLRPLDLNPNLFGMSSLIVPDRDSILREIMRREQENALERQRDIFELSTHQVPILHPHQSIFEPDMSQIMPSVTFQDTAVHRGAAPQAPQVDFRQDQSKLRPRKDRKLPRDVPAKASIPPSKRTKKATDDANKPKVAKKVAAKRNNKWLASYEQLVAYKEKYGNCIVPRGYTPNSRLASWVAEQRKQYKLLQDGKPSSITPERIQLLKNLDFAWNAQGAAWDRHLSDLIRYKNEVGDCLVPLDHPDYPRLGLWVKEQRRHFTLKKAGKQSHMTKERQQALESIGFCWDTHEGVWSERLGELHKYKEEYGHCFVPTSYRKHPKLSSWVHHQRRQFKKLKDGQPCHITLKRIRALDELGFVWHCRQPRKNRKPRRTLTGQNKKARSISLVDSSDEKDSDSGSDSDNDCASECDKTSNCDESDSDIELDLCPSKRQKTHFEQI